ncbi:hypothetical protein K1719_024323 [Acacia pycnantha]|nr:hypothetical protein K1719_024323 [Acacia pycnantha]
MDINGANISGSLPEKLVLLTDLAVIYINSNHLIGPLPKGFRSMKLLFELDLFDMKLDAILTNDNKFRFTLLKNLGNSLASVIILANNDLKGFIILLGVAKMKDTLNEIIVSNSGLSGSLPKEIGALVYLTVLLVCWVVAEVYGGDEELGGVECGA